MAKKQLQKCVICGCDDEHACPDGCHWVQPGLCSRCVEIIVTKICLGIGDLMRKFDRTTVSSKKKKKH